MGSNIRRLRAVTGVGTQKALAETLGIPQSQLSDWENNRFSTPAIGSLIRIAKVFRCSVDALLAGIDADYDRIAKVSATTLPNIAVVAEGDTLPHEVTIRNERPQGTPQVLRWLSRPGDLYDPHAYGVKILGHSMLPTYRPGMIAIVSPELKVRDGDEVYCQLASGERVLRLMHRCTGGYILRPYNPAHSTRMVGRKEIEAMHVVVYSRVCDP